MVWYSHLFENFPQFSVSTQSVFSIVREAEVGVFLELPCFLHDLMNVASNNINLFSHTSGD